MRDMPDISIVVDERYVMMDASNASAMTGVAQSIARENLDRKCPAKPRHAAVPMTTKHSLDQFIGIHVLEGSRQPERQFSNAAPFRHVVIDGFLTKSFADRLLAEFPAFERGNARNEAGELGSKSTVERIRELGASFVELDDLIQSPEFLHLLGELTGIEGLLYDPYYFGGGTHENRAGQDLDPHVDFNRHPIENWHRRLNLIVYLNPEWQDDWGGSLELHTDPRAPENRVSLITPLFNRCVIFEPRVELARIQPHRPACGQKGYSRRSIALYFYTANDPQGIGGTHSTIYVDRPLPEHFKPGKVLDEADIEV